MIQTIWIRGPLPGLNDILDARTRFGDRAHRGGKKWNAYTAMKKAWEEQVFWACKAAHIKPVVSAAFTFTWHERDRRRDPDNISGGGRKLILDGLVVAGIIAKDTSAFATGWEDVFVWGSQHPGVGVKIEGELR